MAKKNVKLWIGRLPRARSMKSGKSCFIDWWSEEPRLRTDSKPSSVMGVVVWGKRWNWCMHRV